MAGHVDGFSQPGTFYDLKKLEPGDDIWRQFRITFKPNHLYRRF
ncbi:hypothetical protein [Planococcus sp. ANT_H30]|nr:hypothetical protein [Planococcus sp. ANT_H30]